MTARICNVKILVSHKKQFLLTELELCMEKSLAGFQLPESRLM